MTQPTKEQIEEILKSLINHWYEFGPEHGFDELVDYASARLATLTAAAEVEGGRENEAFGGKENEAFIEGLLSEIEVTTIERCAQVADKWKICGAREGEMAAYEIARSIRALKDKP